MDRKNTCVETDPPPTGPHASRGEGRNLAAPSRRLRLMTGTVIWGLTAFTPAFAETAPTMTVSFPDTPRQGTALKLRVTFSTPPPHGDFYRLEADVDKTPVALSDLSEESSIWVTIPAQTTGSHTVSVVWRNYPGKKPLIRSKTLNVLPSP